MRKKIADFLTIEIMKNGRPKFACHSSQKGNMYKLLAENGFGQATVNKKRVYYRVNETGIEKTDFRKLVDCIEDFFRFTDFEGLPNGVDNTGLLNWFYTEMPVKKNDLLKYHLTKTALTEEQTHQIRMSEPEYRQKHKIDQILNLFEREGFKSTTDKVEGISPGLTLYYKSLGGQKYLLFSHHSPRNIMTSCFSVWVANYPSDRKIGKVRPQDEEEISANFDMERDCHLISEHFNPSAE